MVNENKKIDINLVNKEYIISILEEDIIKNPKIKEYINELDAKTMLALLIAREHLGSSFDIEKCIDKL